MKKNCLGRFKYNCNLLKQRSYVVLYIHIYFDTKSDIPAVVDIVFATMHNILFLI